MSVRSILQGDIPSLRAVSAPVTDFNESLCEVLDDLTDTLHNHRGLGLAAPQIGVLQRVIVADIGHGVMELVNPVITHSDGVQTEYESCLSLPDFPFKLTRPLTLTLHACDRSGLPVCVEASGLLARVLAHEVDHLDGVLFIDYLSDEEMFQQLLWNMDVTEDSDVPEEASLDSETEFATVQSQVQRQDAQMVLDMIADVSWKLTLIVELLKDCREMMTEDVDLSVVEALTDELEDVFSSLEAQLDGHVSG